MRPSTFKNWLPWAVGLHWLIIVGGMLGGFWLLIPFCLWTPSGLFQLPGLIIWLVLSLSPVFGLIVLKVGAGHRLYVALLIATPVFFGAVLALNSFEVTMCDAP